MTLKIVNKLIENAFLIKQNIFKKNSFAIQFRFNSKQSDDERIKRTNYDDKTRALTKEEMGSDELNKSHSSDHEDKNPNMPYLENIKITNPSILDAVKRDKISDVNETSTFDFTDSLNTTGEQVAEIVKNTFDKTKKKENYDKTLKDDGLLYTLKKDVNNVLDETTEKQTNRE